MDDSKVNCSLSLHLDISFSLSDTNLYQKDEGMILYRDCKHTCGNKLIRHQAHSCSGFNIVHVYFRDVSTPLLPCIFHFILSSSTGKTAFHRKWILRLMPNILAYNEAVIREEFHSISPPPLTSNPSINTLMQSTKETYFFSPIDE